MPHPDDERHMAEGLGRGDKAAAALLLDRAHHAVFAICGRVARDSDRQRDWTHTVLLGVVEDCARGAFEYRGPGSFWAWFRRRAWFRMLNEYRRWRTRENREKTVAEDLDQVCDLAGSEDPVAELERIEIRDAIEHCLASLASPDHRTALSKVMLGGQAYEVVADAMGAPLNTVRAWIRRGRIALRRCLAGRLGMPLPVVEEAGVERNSG